MTDEPPTSDLPPPPRLDTSKVHSARIWNYWLGGKDNFAADRQAGDKIREVYPQIVDVARQSRAFLSRAIRYLAGEAGIRQFLDIGTGLPTVDNTHEIAQRVAPESRIVYVDNDPLVLVHARALLTSHPHGTTTYLDADVRNPDRIIHEAAHTLDFTQPLALLLLGIMNMLTNDDEAYAIVTCLVNALAPGSYLVLQDGTNELEPSAGGKAEQIRSDAGAPFRLRSLEQFTRFFDGLELLEPGIVPTPQWRPGLDPRKLPKLDSHCGVARKP